MRSTGVPCVAVVRRGETEVFRILRDRITNLDLADVIWDRRIEERRTAPSHALASERRRRARRGPPPVTWAPLGFALAAPGHRTPGSSAQDA